jgi:hypothetical protein
VKIRGCVEDTTSAGPLLVDDESNTEERHSLRRTGSRLEETIRWSSPVCADDQMEMAELAKARRSSRN